jgi:hypothetical protein
MWKALVYDYGDLAEDGCIATLREARAASVELPDLLALVRDRAQGTAHDAQLYVPRSREDLPPTEPVAILEWVLATYNAEALRSIAVLYFGHGVCCHTLGALWGQEPRTIIGRLERGYGLPQRLPRHGRPWRVATDAELDALAATLDLDVTSQQTWPETRFQLFAFAPRLYPVPPRLWTRIDAVLAE